MPSCIKLCEVNPTSGSIVKFTVSVPRKEHVVRLLGGGCWYKCASRHGLHTLWHSALAFARGVSDGDWQSSLGLLAGSDTAQGQ